MCPRSHDQRAHQRGVDPLEVLVGDRGHQVECALAGLGERREACCVGQRDRPAPSRSAASHCAIPGCGASLIRARSAGTASRRARGSTPGPGRGLGQLRAAGDRRIGPAAGQLGGEGQEQLVDAGPRGAARRTPSGRPRTAAAERRESARSRREHVVKVSSPGSSRTI